jgi:tripartite-type tricarboxylate transporter receptor subunit TctC
MKRAVLFFAAITFCASAMAQEAYPSKALRIITPAAPGTSPDLLSRVIAQHLSPRVYQQVLVVNQPGGGGNIGHGAVAKSAPDGYTLMVTSDQLSINQTLFSRLPFHALDSFIPVVQAIVSPQVLVVSPKIEAKDVRALVEFARQNPGKLNFGSPQIGTVGHLAGELLKSTQRIDIVHVPFQGATAALKEVQAGNIEMLFVTLPPAMGLIKGGSVRALAVTTPDRASVIPNVPAMREFGYNEFDFGAWQGVFVPAGTPPAVVDKLNRDINSLLKDAEAIAQLTNLGFTPVGGTPEQFRKLVADGIEKWGKVVREAKIKAE